MIESAYYCDSNYADYGDVRHHVIRLQDLYFKNPSKNLFRVNQNVFGDTAVGKQKKLYINIKRKDNIETLIYDEHDIVSFFDMQLDKYVEDIFLNTSIGEIVDKYSILELKKKYITDPNKIIHIDKELNEFNKYKYIKNKYLFLYELLVHINDIIWNDSNVIKNLKPTDENFANVAYDIFNNNQKRYRIKNFFNILYDSNIKEQKSYNSICSYLIINSEYEILLKIPEINYLCLENDFIYVNEEHKNLFNNLFIMPNIIFYSNDEEISNMNSINLSNYQIDPNLHQYYEYKPLVYISEGLLGDLVHQLSVIFENFLNYGRKGVLYLREFRTDSFKYGIKKAYEDTYEVFIKQIYIQKYEIYNNQYYDINLSIWRFQSYFINVDYLLSSTFHVNWGINKWLNVPTDNKWENYVLINTTSYRFVEDAKIFENIVPPEPYKMLFVSFEKDEYDYFMQQINNRDVKIDIEYYCPESLYELCIMINSCYVLIASYSAPLAFCYALHKKCYALSAKEHTPNNFYLFNKFEHFVKRLK